MPARGVRKKPLPGARCAVLRRSPPACHATTPGWLQGPGDFGAPALRAFLQALSSALLMNICIVGINQVSDPPRQPPLTISAVRGSRLFLSCFPFLETGRLVGRLLLLSPNAVLRSPAPEQIYDIEIDRVNKPYLPLAAGDFGVGTGVAIVVSTGAAALATGGLWGVGSRV